MPTTKSLFFQSILTDHVANTFDDTKRIDPDGISLQENIYSSRSRIPSNSGTMRSFPSKNQNRCLQWVMKQNNEIF